MTIKVTRYEQERELAGEYIRVHLKNGGHFNLKVTETEPGAITGFDDERINIKVDVKDIDFVLIGGNRVEYC